MKVFLVISTPIIGLIGLLVLAKAIRESRMIYLGVVNSRDFRLANAFLTGSSSGMLFLTLIITVGLLEENYHWSLAGLFISIIISCIFGLIAFLGTYFGFAIIKQYSGFLGRRISGMYSKSKIK